jgi:hypothetical protein
MDSGLREIVENQRLNAVLGWVVVAVLLAAAVADAVDGSFVGAAFPLALAGVVVVPPIVRRSPWVMLPWELVGVAALPAAGRFLIIGQELLGVTLTGRVTTYFAVAAVALILAVEIDVFTPVRMNHTFAVLFVVMTTMAAAGMWAMLTWLSDQYLGTALMMDGRPEEVIEATVMWDFVAATGVGLLAGVVFDRYIRNRLATDERLPAHGEIDLYPGEDQTAGSTASTGNAKGTATGSGTTESSGGPGRRGN